MSKWKLVKVEDIEWRQDESGYYTLINYVGNIDCQPIVRLDVMTTDDNPLISFEGTASAVRKNAMRYADENCWNMSLEHAAYVGWELLRASIDRETYKQD